MSTKTDTILPAGQTIDLDGGGVATSNGDGTFTLSGFTGQDTDLNGTVWGPSYEGAPGAEQVEEFGNMWFAPVVQ